MDDRLFGPYRLDELIGRGGMGEVYRAYDTGRRRVVALKRLPAALALDPEFRERFRRESALVAQLREPHIIPIHDFGEIDGRLYIDMRLVEGTDLESVLAQGPLPPARAVDVITQVADALDAAHDAGVVHRDVKPSNVLLFRAPGATDPTARDFAYLIDFGIARSVGGTGITRVGMAPGTPQYMAPELWRGKQADQRADVYALACVLFECLTGQRAHPADNLAALLDSDLRAEPPKPSQVAQGVPAGFDKVIAAGLAKEPLDRYPTPGMLAARARAVLETSPSSPIATPRPERVESPPDPPQRPGRPAQKPPGSRPTPAPGHPEPVRGAQSAARNSSWSATATVAATPRPAPTVPPVRPPTGPPERTEAAPRRRAIPHALLLLIPALLAVVAVGGVVAQIGSAKSVPVGQQPAAAAISPDGLVLYVADRQAAGEVLAVDARTRTPRGFPIPVGAQPSDLQVSPDGSRVYVANEGSGSVTVIDTSNSMTLPPIPVGAGPASLAVSPEGSRLYVANRNAGSVTVIDTATATPVGNPIRVRAQPSALALSPDGGLLFVANQGDNSVSLIDTAEATAADPIPVGTRPVALAASTDGRKVYVANQGSNTVSVIEVASATVIRDGIPAGLAPSAIAVRPDGRRIYLTGQDSGTLTAIDPMTNALVGDPVEVGVTPFDVAVTPDSKTIIVVGQNPAGVSFRAA